MFKLILKRKCLYLKIVKMIKVEFFLLLLITEKPSVVKALKTLHRDQNLRWHEKTFIAYQDWINKNYWA